MIQRFITRSAFTDDSENAAPWSIKRKSLNACHSAIKNGIAVAYRPSTIKKTAWLAAGNSAEAPLHMAGRAKMQSATTPKPIIERARRKKWVEPRFARSVLMLIDIWLSLNLDLSFVNIFMLLLFLPVYHLRLQGIQKPPLGGFWFVLVDEVHHPLTKHPS